MEYQNLFLNKTDTELEIMYEQYLAWNRTGVLDNNELGAIRDEYCKMDFSTPLLVVERDLLREIAKHWVIDRDILKNLPATEQEDIELN